jgi:hypothetical protein
VEAALALALQVQVLRELVVAVVVVTEVLETLVLVELLVLVEVVVDSGLITYTVPMELVRQEQLTPAAVAAQVVELSTWPKALGLMVALVLLLLNTRTSIQSQSVVV